MPLYEYRCLACRREFEKEVPLSAIGARPECPHCGSRETQKKISAYGAAGRKKSSGISETPSRPERFT